MGLNGGKTLTRIALDDPGTVNTMDATAKAVNELAERKLMAMVEPFWSSRVDGKVRNDLSAGRGDQVRRRVQRAGPDLRLHLDEAAGGATRWNG